MAPKSNCNMSTAVTARAVAIERNAAGRSVLPTLAVRQRSLGVERSA